MGLRNDDVYIYKSAIFPRGSKLEECLFLKDLYKKKKKSDTTTTLSIKTQHLCGLRMRLD